MSVLAAFKSFVSPEPFRNFHPPAPDWIKGAMSVNTHTPDYALLERFEFIRVFVYGRMMKGLSENNLLGVEARRLTNALTKYPYQMFLKEADDGIHPIILPSNGTKLRSIFIDGKEGYRGPASIRGEIHKVRPWDILGLDRYMENGVVFVRKHIKLIVPTSKIVAIRERVGLVRNGQVESIVSNFSETPVIREIRAYTYIGLEGYWGDMVADDFVGITPPRHLMGPGKIYKPNNPSLTPFYYFNQHECIK